MLLAPGLSAQETGEEGGDAALERVISPDLERPRVEEAVIDRENFEAGVYSGILSMEDFGSNRVTGLRLAYHVSEFIFLETSLARSTLSSTSADRLYPEDAPFLSESERDLDYYTFSIGYNLLPGEVFIGRDWAFNTSFYLLGGVGNTRFADENFFTYNIGGGLRFFVADWLTLHLDLRDHILDHDLFGEEITTHNMETHAGLTLFF